MYCQFENELQKRKNFLEKIIAEKENALQSVPDGNLRFRQDGSRFYYYCRTDPKDTVGKYIKKKDCDFAAALAQKEYDKKVLKLAQSELKNINSLLKQYEKGQIDTIYEKLQKPRQNLIRPVIPTDEQYINNWQAAVYEKKDFSYDASEFFTVKGERVRSKSEIIIADTLSRMNIPYRYEYPLKLKGIGTIHPDFMVLNVRLRKTFIWEHFGMMDDPEYSARALAKINSYEKNGYFPGSPLILTHETSSRPIRTKLIEELISHYLK